MRTEFIGNESMSCAADTLHYKTKNTQWVGPLAPKKANILIIKFASIAKKYSIIIVT